jgi:hypothetical protein
MGRTPLAWSGRHTGRACRRRRSAWHESAANEPLRCRGETEMHLLLHCGRARRSQRWRTGVVELKGEAWWSLSRRMARRPPRRPRLCSVPRFAVGGLSRRMAGGLLIVSANVAGLKHGSATRKELADGAMDLRVWRHWRPRKAATPWLEAEPREREGEGGGPARGGGAGE